MSLPEVENVGVIGAGSWGTALSYVLGSKGYDVHLWAFEPELVETINTKHVNDMYLDGIELPREIHASNDLEAVCNDKDMIVVVTPSHVLRKVMSDAADYLPMGVPIVSATKGIENDTLKLVSEIHEEVLPIDHHPYLAYISGPTFAKEVAQEMPTNAVVASYSDKLATHVQHAFHNDFFRTYRSVDVVGVELGGALKNVIAIASGAAAGMGFGHNTSIGLVTRGLAEMSRLAVALGANPLTLAGLTGMGDLVLTCTGGLSRNRRVGMELGKGKSLDEILDDMNMVAEGVKTARSVYDLSREVGVEMPICHEVYRVLYEDKDPSDALQTLMSRDLKRESFGF
jgi:glycerol-3-phosphate dehydrogenase (NAD(P)+)